MLLATRPGAAQGPYPDFDLRAECPGRLEGPARGVQEFPVEIGLRVRAGDAAPDSGARAWSLSLQATPAARIVEASTRGTDIPEGIGVQGYEKTELTHGEGNEGAVSAVILSLVGDLQLPLSGDFVLLHLTVAADVPEKGCQSHSVSFVDGLAGSGQPVRNVITCSEGVTRRDDGGPLDNDDDSYETCSLQMCAAYSFVRGNLNGDLNVDVSDTVFLLASLFRGDNSLGCLRAADVNGDDSVNVSDAVYLLNHLFKGGSTPVAPYPACGFAPSPGSLTCEVDPECD
jgi:hypothetical protein